MASTPLHPPEFIRAAIELMIADGGDRQTHRIQRLDGWLVVKERGDERRCANQVASGDDDRVRVSRDVVLEVSGEVLCASGRGTADQTVCARRRLQVSVEVI